MAIHQYWLSTHVFYHGRFFAARFGIIACLYMSLLIMNLLAYE